MSIKKIIISMVSILALTGVMSVNVVAAEVDVDAYTAECESMAKSEGVADVETYIADCVNAKMGDAMQGENRPAEQQ